jgi:hypothetical protein
MGSTMKLPRSSADRLGLEIIELADRERPPMIRIPEYVERRAAHAEQRAAHAEVHAAHAAANGLPNGRAGGVASHPAR